MADPRPANYVFLPWVRQGAAAGIQITDREPDQPQPGFVSIPVSLRVNDHPIDPPQTVRLYGPGDITGIDPQQVIRTEPRHLATNFEPNYFPCIEFDRPEFPWLFTPGKANDLNQLRPWLCLVVVRKQEGVSLDTNRSRPLPVLEIGEHARFEQELPNLADCWAWAHVQVTGVDLGGGSKALRDGLAGDPAFTVSRLICPRRLDPATEYLACVVPTFELGRLAGLGEPISSEHEETLIPAWTLPEPPEPRKTPLRLPVYFHWEFRTGTSGDFEALVSLLEPLAARLAARPNASEILSKLGRRPIDISQPGFEINPPLPQDTTLELEGALRVRRAPATEWPNGSQRRFQEALKPILNAPWQALQQGGEPLLAPPIYGCWQAARHMVGVPAEQAVSSAPSWLDELNLDPRHRAVAALGTQVVQAQQEQLMASAWEQLGEIQRANQLRRQAQLARAVNQVFYVRHFGQFSDEALLKVIAPAQSRVVIETVDSGSVKTRALLSHTISNSAVPTQAISAPLRRFTSPRGAIGSRFRVAAAAPIRIVTRLNRDSVVLFQKPDAKAVTVNRLSDRSNAEAFRKAVRFARIAAALETAPSLPDFQIVSEGMPKRSLLDFRSGLPESPDAQIFRKAALEHQDSVMHQIFKTGWHHFRFVFPGGDGILYAVDRQGRLLFYRDPKQDGSVDIRDFSIIGSGLQDMTQVFSGGNGILYAVDQPGRLLFFRDKNQDGMGDIGAPSVIGLGGWQFMRFIFPGGNGIIYAIDQDGRLLFYRDQTQDGTGDVANPSVIGPGGWQGFQFLFPGGNGIIYAIDQDGRLLSTRDTTRDGTGSVANPSITGAPRTGFSMPQLDLPKMKAALLRSVDPEVTVRARVLDALKSSGATGQPDDALEPLLDAPEFPQPMYEALRDLSQDFLFPGLEHVPTNTVTLLETNPKFVESFLVGLNAEMSRELLWRGYPTDQRGTYFRQFWDTSSGKSKADIGRIDEWGDTELGKHPAADADADARLVLLVRGELLRRYPNSVIYAVEATPDGELSENESHPVFRGTLKPDVTFLGFDLEKNDAIADPGWFFVIQEQPTEPRFGMDAADFTKKLPQLTTWNDLNWRHLADTEERLKALSHAPAEPVPEKIADLSQKDKAKWGRNAAHQAYITLQRPVRIAIHAKKLIQ
jgi:hypothetical protein